MPPAVRATRRRWQTNSSIGSASSDLLSTWPSASASWFALAWITSSSSDIAATRRRMSLPHRADASAVKSCHRCAVQFRKLGASGLLVSAIGLGCNPFGNEVDQATARDIVSAALDAGVNYFDTADSYYEGRSETYLGQALRDLRARDQVIVATK